MQSQVLTGQHVFCQASDRSRDLCDSIIWDQHTITITRQIAQPYAKRLTRECTTKGGWHRSISCPVSPSPISGETGTSPCDDHLFDRTVINPPLHFPVHPDGLGSTWRSKENEPLRRLQRILDGGPQGRAS